MSNQEVDKPYDSAFQLYICDFFPETGEIRNNWKKVTGPDLPNNMIDGHIDFIDGSYYLWYKDENTKMLKLAVSDDYLSGYKSYETDLHTNPLISYE